MKYWRVVLFALGIAGFSSQVLYAAPKDSPKIVAQLSLTGQTGALPPTTLFIAPSSGIYRISKYVVVTAQAAVSCTPNSGNPFIGLALHWTDDATGVAEGIFAGSLGFGSPVGDFSTSDTVVVAKAGTPITYEVQFLLSTTGMTCNENGFEYNLYLVAEQL